ncbi:MAG: RdgB/HAM1 family non-canonical purine NTP pyrophosphatase [Acidimicrobiales bacterium]|jgi:XTP/dITP diphosphohydrolase
MPRLRLVLATANRDKAAEIIDIVRAAAGGSVELVACPEGTAEVDETGDTLEENARLKARALVELTGLPAVADDTGLEVDALGGEPGVRSSRYAGIAGRYDENVTKLLAELEAADATTAHERRARFRTVTVACFPDGHEVFADGLVEGTIVFERQGVGGFGYDPVFVPAGQERTFAEMQPQEKHAISQRGRAFRALVDALLEDIDSREA